MILGSLVGFVTGTGFGMASRSSWAETLWRACAAALIVAVLMRWWARIWANSLRDALKQRQSQPAAAKPTTKP